MKRLASFVAVTYIEVIRLLVVYYGQIILRVKAAVFFRALRARKNTAFTSKIIWP